MIRRAFDALLLDVDGTLVDRAGRIAPRVRASLHAAAASGVRVVLATGRSEVAVAEVLQQLGLDELAIVYNGAGVFCPRRGRLIEERVLANRTAARILEIVRRERYPTVVQRAGARVASPPSNDAERALLERIPRLAIHPDWELPLEYAIRATIFSQHHASSDELCRDLEREIDLPVYVTHFPLSLLSPAGAGVAVADIHPPCRGKAEALRVLEETYGIPPERVVAVGDAANDVPMFEAAGLAVAMGDGMDEALRAADRVIGGHETDALADLCAELFAL